MNGRHYDQLWRSAVAFALSESRQAFERVRAMRNPFPRPTAAKGGFPYPHRTMAEVEKI